MSALLNPGDEILVPDPRYTSYDQAIEHAGAVSVTVPTHPQDAFDLKAETLEALITPRTKALLLVTPSTRPAASSPAKRRRRSRFGAQARLRGDLRRDLRQVRVAAASSTSRSARCRGWRTRSPSPASARPGR
jgi:hypothetical protein